MAIINKMLEKAFAVASGLSEEDQERIATLILEEIEDERRWDDVFAGSQDVLSALADDALAAIRAGETVERDPGDLPGQ